MSQQTFLCDFLPQEQSPLQRILDHRTIKGHILRRGMSLVSLPVEVLERIACLSGAYSALALGSVSHTLARKARLKR